MTPGEVLVLTGKTLAGKNRVAEQGARWKVLRVDFPAFFKGNQQAALLQAMDNPNNQRWIMLPEDRHFTWETEEVI